jgi:hypothetical protein
MMAGSAAGRLKSRQQQHEVPLRGLDGCLRSGRTQSAQADFVPSLQRLRSARRRPINPDLL